MSELLHHLGIQLPIIQAPMAGISTPEMAAAVSNAGGLGSVAVGHVAAETARTIIRQVRGLTDRPFNVNVFCHQPAVADPAKESAWLRMLTPHFSQFASQPPQHLREIYTSFITDDAMLATLLEERPPIVSFHFGLPSPGQIAALKSAGIFLLATATNLTEAELCHAAGINAIVAQGYEAGGHRGVFNPHAPDEGLTTLALVRRLVAELPIPVIAAGGLMDGPAIAGALSAGASAAQLGTAFLLCPESSADSGYRQALSARPTRETVMTSAISGRPARSIANRFTALGESVSVSDIPDYPIAYDAGKELHSAAKRQGEFGYGAQWAGQGLSQARTMPAAELVRCLDEELRASTS